MLFTEQQMLEKAKQDKLHVESMTVFYSENTGKIEEIVSGVQDFSHFVNDRLDKESYLKILIFDINLNILENKGKYKINLDTNEIIFNEDLTPITPKNLGVSI